VAHAYYPSYSGSRDQEDSGLKPAQGNSLQDPISKNPSKNRAGGVAQGEGPEFKPQNWKKKVLSFYSQILEIYSILKLQ
jgi:hypothetical protein